MNNKINIQDFADCELCLLVSNTEDLYNIAFIDIDYNRLMIAINSNYSYNNKQLLTLNKWLRGAY